MCHGCTEWLIESVTSARSLGTGRNAAIASPLSLRAPDSEHSCGICRAALSARASVVGVHSLADGADVLAGGLCDACEQWLISLAIDARSARHISRRHIDGPYGSVLHPKMTHLRVGFAIEDASTEASLRSIAVRAGIHCVEADEAAPGDVLFVDVTARGRDWTLVPRNAGAAVIAVARAETAGAIPQALAAGAVDWITVPFTPQQVVGALRRVAAGVRLAARWDLRTGAPHLASLDSTRPVIEAVPRPGIDPLIVSWSLRRFARGYDDLATHTGSLLLVPFARTDNVAAIVDRLAILLGERAHPLPYEPPVHRSLDASA